MKIGIVGLGVVGKAHQKLFADTVAYDIDLGTKDEINSCDVAFVCVPTERQEDGSCDTSIVEEVVAWIETPLIIIRSTIPPGTTERLKEKYNKRIVFQPEYIGETPAHPFADISNQPFMVFGGDPEDINSAITVWQEVTLATTKIYQADSKTAELCKLMENAFIGTKVTFCQEMYNIAKKMGVDYNILRELWLADPRVSRFYTYIFENERGFGGKCLPKDINSLRYESKSDFFKFILEHNDKIRHG